MGPAQAADMSTTEVAGEAASMTSELPSASRMDVGAGQLTFRGGPLTTPALTALFPDFVTSEPAVAGLAAWRGARGSDRMRARAAGLGAPFLTLDCGLLRAPPQYRAASAVLSVTAVAMVGPFSSADILSADRLLVSRGWETPALLERA